MVRDRVDVVTRLRANGLVEHVLADLLGMEEPPRPGSAIRCAYPDRHKNGDAHPSLVVWKDGEGAKCLVCGFGGGLLEIARDRLALPDRKSAAAELARRYLGDSAFPPKPGAPTGPPQATYDYRDEEGRLLFQVLRYPTIDADGKPDKTFRFRRPDPQRPGAWIWQLGETRRVLFRLPQVLAAVREGKTIYIAEGEKDVLALDRAGIVATCNPGGAGKWRKECTETLRGAKVVVVVADKDEPGRRHALAVAQALRSVVGEVRVVEAAVGKDAADHLGAGKTPEDFVPFDAEDQGEPPASNAAATSDLPRIEVTADMQAVVDAAETALRAAPGIEIYQRMEGLVRVSRDDARKIRGLQRPARAPVISPVPDAHLRELAAGSAFYYKTSPKSGLEDRVLPPVWAVAALAARGRWGFPYLEAVTEAPALRADGSILDRPGYDELSGLLYEPNAVFPVIPSAPTEAERKEALRILLEPFDEFCFVAESDRSATLATILTQIGRHAIHGPTPMLAVLAHAPGTGKGLLVQASTLIATGRLPTLMAPSLEPQEFGKVVTTLAMEGHRAVLLDNAEGRFGSAVLAAALTATEWSGRVLGYSRTVTAPLLAVWYVTGNNLAFVGDTHRRIVPVFLDAKVERPEDRTFRHPDLLAYIARERPRLYVAGLILLRAFIEAGRPGHGGPRMGSYEAWDDLVRAAVIWLTGEDPCAGRTRVREEDDADRELMRALFTAWRSAFPNRAASTVHDAVRRAESDEHLRRALAALDIRGDGTRLDTRAIGYALRRFRGRIVGGLRLERAYTVQAGVLWQVVAVDPAGEAQGDHADHGDVPSGSGFGPSAGDTGDPPEADGDREDHHRDDRDHLPPDSPTGDGRTEVDL